jgi:hypothetical protein
MHMPEIRVIQAMEYPIYNTTHFRYMYSGSEQISLNGVIIKFK